MRIAAAKPALKRIERILLNSSETLYLEGIKGLSRGEIARYLAGKIHSSHKGRDFIIIGDKRHVLQGMAVIGSLPWDSGFLKRRVARIDLMVTDRYCPGRAVVYRELLSNILELWRNERTDIVFFRNPADGIILNRILTSMGSVKTSTIYNMYRPEKRGGCGDMGTGQRIPVRIRKPKKSEYKKVESLMFGGYGNRLLFEPLFEGRNVRGLYREWIRNNLNGRVKEVLIAEAEGQIAGFIAFDLLNIGRKRYGFIDMIFVRSDFRKKGIGKALLAEALDHLRENTLGTYLGVENDKKEAIKLYMGMDFHLLNRSYTFHIVPGMPETSGRPC